MKYFLVSGLLMLVCGVRAQTDSLRAEQLMGRAKSCLSEGKTDSAHYFHTEALQVFKNRDLLKPWLRSYASLGYIWADDVEQPFTGTDLIQRGIAAKWRAPRTPAEWEQLALTYIAAGHIRRVNAGDFVGARDFYEQGYHVFETQLNGQSDKIAKYIYHNLGNIYTRLGDYPRAENMLRKGVAYGYTHPELGTADQSDLAIVLMELGRNEEALNTIEEGLHIKNAGPKVVITMLQNKAALLHRFGKTADALRTIRSVPARIAELSFEQDSLYYSMLNHITEAELLADRKMYKQAEDLYQKAIREGESHWGTGRRREIAKVYCALGNLHYSQQQYQPALDDFHRALLCVVKGFTATQPEQLPDPALFISENTIIEALEGKAQCFVALGRLEKALQCYEQIPIAGALLIATHAYESSSLITLQEGRARFDKAIDIAWQLYQKAGEQSYAERAFNLTEQARAILLLQSIARARNDYNLPPEIRVREHELDAKIVWLEQQIAAEEQKGAAASNQKLEQLKENLFKFKQEQQHFREQLRKDHPEYAGLSAQLSFLGVQGVPKLLRADQALLDFYLTETDIYVFYFNKNGSFKARKAAMPTGFQDEVLRYFSFMSSNIENPDEKIWYLKKSYEWYRLLLQPETEGTDLKSLQIIPDGVLTFIPFDVLLTNAAPPDARWRELPLLLKKYATGYAYSATLWDMQQKISADHRRNSSPKYRFAGFAPDYESAMAGDGTRGVTIPDSLIYNIKNTEQELDKVHALMGGMVFKNAGSSERQFKEIAPDCGILLLAMHGLANDEYPELSCLLFGRPKGDSINNDVLFANELQIMQLQADLAVLSACHTGFGKLQKGEGVYSLARAFAVAGVPSTVMSIWRLHETTAPLLTEAFFKYLKAGKTKDEALRLAKLDFLENDMNYERTHPFYWAGVTVGGDMCALQFSRWWYWLPGAAGLFAIGYLIWRRTRKRWQESSK